MSALLKIGLRLFQTWDRLVAINLFIISFGNNKFLKGRKTSVVKQKAMKLRKAIEIVSLGCR